MSPVDPISLVNMGLLWGRALQRWRRAGKPIRSDEEVSRLLENCQETCKFYNAKWKSCGICGCKLSKSHRALLNKLRMATEQCPADPPRFLAIVPMDAREQVRNARQNARRSGTLGSKGKIIIRKRREHLKKYHG